MTFVFTLLVGAGALLIISALENTSIAATLQNILAGKSPTGKPSTTFSGPPANNGGGSAGGF